MNDTIEPRVALGVALLDKTLADWDERIDLEQLNLRDTCDCILGQEFYSHPDAEFDAFGNSPFDIGLRELFADERNPGRAAIAHGFDAADALSLTEYDELTAEWIRVIEARRSAS